MAASRSRPSATTSSASISIRSSRWRRSSTWSATEASRARAMTPYGLFLVAGLALGAIYALSGVGLVVLYRATGVLNLAYGAIGAMGAMVAWQLGQWGWPEAAGWMAAILV